MNAAIGLGLLALALQTSDQPQLPTNGIPSQVTELILEHMPDAIYGGATATGEEITYVGGMDWKVGRRWGVGAEYRQWSDRLFFAGKNHDVVIHVAAPYVYRELPAIGSLTLRTDLGAGVLWGESSGMEASETWVASIRASGRVELSPRFDLVVWVGAVYLAGTEVSSGRSTAKTRSLRQPETGLALRLKL